MRRELALRYLQDTKLSISQVAWLLGFQEAGAVTHAFRRWTGQMPSEIRRSELLPDRIAPRPRSAARPQRTGKSSGGFYGCIDGLSFWLMRIAREIGRGTSVQALRERTACQERAD